MPAAQPDPFPAAAADARRDSVYNTLRVAFLVSLVCSILVSTSVVVLRPIQQENRLIEGGVGNVIRLLDAIGDFEDIDAITARLESRLVNLDTGTYVEDADVARFNPETAAGDPEQSTAIPPAQDHAGLQRRANHAVVHLLRDGDGIRYIVLPVHGSGMWSTLRGYIALEADGNTIAGFKIFEHAETPGIGDKVDRPGWLATWEGKRIYGDDGAPAIEIVKGKVAAKTAHQVEALTGATKTAEGVTGMLRYWFSEHGYKPYLEQITGKENE